MNLDFETQDDTYMDYNNNSDSYLLYKKNGGELKGGFIPTL